MFTNEELLREKKVIEDAKTKRSVLEGRIEGLVADIKKTFNVESSVELKELKSNLELEKSKAVTEYETACEQYRKEYDV